MAYITCTTFGLQYKKSNDINHKLTDIWQQVENTIFINVQNLRRFFLLIHLLFFMNVTIQNYYHKLFITLV